MRALGRRRRAPGGCLVRLGPPASRAGRLPCALCEVMCLAVVRALRNGARVARFGAFGASLDAQSVVSWKKWRKLSFLVQLKRRHDVGIDFRRRPMHQFRKNAPDLRCGSSAWANGEGIVEKPRDGYAGSWYTAMPTSQCESCFRQSTLGGCVRAFAFQIRKILSPRT